MPMRLYATSLTASRNDRVIRGRLLPFDEDGHTSLGRVRASAASALEVPAAPLLYTLEHDDATVLGTVEVVKGADGWDSVAYIFPTAAGDAALADVEAGRRAAQSVELDNPQIGPAGQLLAGVFRGGSLVAQPAFPSARLAASEQPYAPPTTDQTTREEPAMNCATCGTVHDAATGCPEATATEATTTEATTEATTTEAAATAPTGGLVASRAAGTSSRLKASASDLFSRIAAAAAETGGNPLRLTAALADIVPGNILGLEQPQYIGQLWNGNSYQRRIIPLFNHATLTSFKIEGWRWVTKPAVASYAGNKTAVPSNAVSTEAVEEMARRIAGAHDIDRKFVDFRSDGFWKAYYDAMTESYKRVSDGDVLADAVANAKTVTSGAVPTGIAAGLVKVVDGALSVLADTDTVPTFAVVASNLWRDIMFTRSEDVLAYLNAALGLEDGQLGGFRLMPSAQLSAGEVLVGVKSAATVHELGGEAPIRVEAPNIAQGGVDAGVFGYLGVVFHDTDGLVLVDKAAG